MIGKGFVLVLLMAPFPLFAFVDTEGENIPDKLDALEEIIFEAESETASCQLHSSWHFPLKLYAYVRLAKRYSENLRRAKHSKKFEEALRGLLQEVDECIDGKKGYWSGNWGDVWVDPVPSVPDCALESFKKMRNELETAVNSLL